MSSVIVSSYKGLYRGNTSDSWDIMPGFPQVRKWSGKSQGILFELGKIDILEKSQGKLK